MGKFDPLGLVTPEPSEQAQMFNLYQRDWWLLMLKTLDAVAVNTAGGGGGGGSSVGAANLNTAQATATNVASTALIARPTRKSAALKNTSGAVTLFFGPVGVTALTGFPLGPGESIGVTQVGVTEVITAGGAATYSIADEYD